MQKYSKTSNIVEYYYNCISISVIILIWCISYYRYWKQLINIFVEIVILFLMILWWIESSKEHLFEIFCNVINVFIVIFDQFNVFLLNNSINLLKTSKQTNKQTYWPKLLNGSVNKNKNKSWLQLNYGQKQFTTTYQLVTLYFKAQFSLLTNQLNKPPNLLLINS